MRRLVNVLTMFFLALGGSVAVNAPSAIAVDSPIAISTAAAPVKPVGHVDGWELSNVGITVYGWAVAPGRTDRLRVDIYLDGKRIGGQVTFGTRPDVAAAYPGVGTGHGFYFGRAGDSSIPVVLQAGRHQFCAFAVRPAGTTGVNANIGCYTVTTTDNPVSFHKIEAWPVRGNDYWIVGDAHDFNTLKPIRVHVYVDGRGVKSVLANWDGLSHVGDGDMAAGFNPTIRLPKDGKVHSVCVYGINATGTAGDNVQLPSCVKIRSKK